MGAFVVPETSLTFRTGDIVYTMQVFGSAQMPSEYPYHDRRIRVTRCGRICLGRRKISLSKVFAGQMVGLREVADDMWLVSFMSYDLGYFDNEVDRVEPTTNPFQSIPEDMVKL